MCLAGKQRFPVPYLHATVTIFQTIDGIVNISGDLHVTGNITYTDVEAIISQNSLIKLVF